MTAKRSTIQIPSHGELLEAWHYAAPSGAGARKNAVVVLGHGLGAVKEMRLDAFAERFQQAGYHAVVFDYRFFGGSTGQPRQLLGWRLQQQDWDAVLDFVRKQEWADEEKIALFGTSFGGGHVLEVASRHADVAAVISQCPFTSGLASTRQASLLDLLSMSWLALRDALWSMVSSSSVVPVTLAARPGQVALMSAPDVMDGYLGMVPAGFDKPNWVGARVVLTIPLLRPGACASKVKAPIFWAVCMRDTVAPAEATLGFARRQSAEARRGEVRRYDVGHFDIYVGEAFERAVGDYVGFLQRHVPVAKL